MGVILLLVMTLVVFVDVSFSLGVVFEAGGCYRIFKLQKARMRWRIARLLPPRVRTTTEEKLDGRYFPNPIELYQR